MPNNKDKVIKEVYNSAKYLIIGGFILFLVSSLFIAEDNKKCGVTDFPENLNLFACKDLWKGDHRAEIMGIASIVFIILGISIFVRIKISPDMTIKTHLKKQEEIKNYEHQKDYYIIPTEKQKLKRNFAIVGLVSSVVFYFLVSNFIGNLSELWIVPLLLLAESLLFIIPLFRVLEYFTTGRTINFRDFVKGKIEIKKGSFMSMLCYALMSLGFIIIFLKFI